MQPPTRQELADLRQRAGIHGDFYTRFHECNERHDPMPVDPKLGPVLTPPSDLVEIIGDPDADGSVHILHGKIHANASWEPVNSAENRKSQAMAEYLCALVNWHATTPPEPPSGPDEKERG